LSSKTPRKAKKWLPRLHVKTFQTVAEIIFGHFQEREQVRHAKCERDSSNRAANLSFSGQIWPFFNGLSWKYSIGIFL